MTVFKTARIAEEFITCHPELRENFEEGYYPAEIRVRMDKLVKDETDPDTVTLEDGFTLLVEVPDQKKGFYNVIGTGLTFDEAMINLAEKTLERFGDYDELEYRTSMTIDEEFLDRNEDRLLEYNPEYLESMRAMFALKED